MVFILTGKRFFSIDTDETALHNPKSEVPVETGSLAKMANSLAFFASQEIPK